MLGPRLHQETIKMTTFLNFGNDSFLKTRLIGAVILLCLFQRAIAQSNDESGITTGASLSGTSISKLSKDGGIRNILIEITNHLDSSLVGGDHYLEHGDDKTPPPTKISSMTVEVVQFEKNWHSTNGVAGILSYSVNDNRDSATFVVAFSVPLDYVVSSNWFGLAFVDKDTSIDKELYDKFHDEHSSGKSKADKKFAYASDGSPISVSHKDYIISASMSNVGKSVLTVDVQYRAGAHGKNNRN